MNILLFLLLAIFVTMISAIGVSQIETRGIATTTVSIVKDAQSSDNGQLFDPAKTTVNPGDMIIWKNEDTVAHTATSGQNATSDGRFDTGLISSNQSTQPISMPSEPGEYQYFCKLHPGETGTVKVYSATSSPDTHESSSAPFTLGERGEERSSTNGGNVILLSQRYNEERYSSEIVGEVENNGTEPVKFVKVTVTFYDSSGDIVGTENTYADPSDLRPDMRAPFKIFLTNDAIIDETATYAFTISWDNPDGSTGVTTVSDQSLEQTSGGGVEDEGCR
jgi:plastocyanin